MPAADYCDFSEMRVVDCHHCKTGARTLAPVVVQDPDDVEDDGFPGRAAPATPGPWIEAEYFGHCSKCSREVKPGDLIRADGRGGWQCSACA